MADEATNATGPAQLTEEWCMNMAKIEARAAELHEGCRMPMEQAREIAASEASPDWYARGQDWGLADALTNGQSGDWVLDDIARAFAAGASAAERAGCCAEALPPEVAQARQTAEYWKAEHLAGNARIGELHDELAATALRSAGYLRSAIKAESHTVEPLRRLWPLIERSVKGYVFTSDKAGEVAADMAALRKAIES